MKQYRAMHSAAADEIFMLTIDGKPGLQSSLNTEESIRAFI